jgi:ubiquitin C-terminal hydrolase
VQKWVGSSGSPQQADSVEFLQLFLERLEWKSVSGTRLFKGRFKHTIQSQDFSRDSEEEFLTLPLEVKGSSDLGRSLKAFLLPTHSDKYSVDGVGKIGVDKYTRISVCPEILIVQLKRFKSNISLGQCEKLHNRFVFPFEFDLSPVTENDEMEQIYELVGVIVHSGFASGGHYFNRICVNEEWMTFDDCSVNSANRNALIENCAGDEFNWQLRNYHNSQ